MQFSIKALSHHTLGKYLSEHYLPCAPKRYVLAFLLGCTEPDKNPATYLKGSFANRWLRGHNWESSRNYIRRLSLRLEKRRTLRLWDFYAMGKLIHYIADAFTFPHNGGFSQDLLAHRSYEADLQTYFLTYLAAPRCHMPAVRGSVMDTIRRSHRQYAAEPADIRRDSHYAVAVSCSTLCLLLAERSPYLTIPSP